MVRRIADPMLTFVGTVAGAHGTRRVGLTFDDGPDEFMTPAVLDVLRAHGVTATFFVLTSKAETHPELMTRIVAEGHEVGLHFDTHQRLTELSKAEAWSRLVSALDALERMVGPVRFFRPPFGGQSLSTYMMARRLGLEVVAWGSNAQDWVEQLPETAAGKALKDAAAGGIILLHDGLEMPAGEQKPTFNRAEMVRLVLEGLKLRGLIASSVGALLADGRTRHTAWFRA